MQNTSVVILAAGKGTRLGCTDMPKVMLEIGGRPIVSYTVETLEAMGFTPAQIVMVVGFHADTVREYFDGRVSYADQTERKGTAHAAYVGMKELPEDVDTVLVIQGDDSAFYTAETLQHFIEAHKKSGSVLSLLSVKLENPESYGRIVRHENGDIEIIEKEYVTDEQKKIQEVSTGTFCYNRRWFEEMFPSMPPLRKLGEYAQPTAMAMAREQKQPYQVVQLEDSKEWFGVNTKEELEEADKRKRQ